MKNHFQNIFGLLLVTFIAFSVLSCRERTDEETILGFMEEIRRYAEERDIEGIMVNLAEDYSDFEGRNKWQTRDMIDDYFRQYKGIVIHMLSSRITELNPPLASVESEVALSSGAAKIFRKLVTFSTENYRLNIDLIRTAGRWKIQKAEWRYVTIEELYPESMAVLKKIFPGVWN